MLPEFWSPVLISKEARQQAKTKRRLHKNKELNKVWREANKEHTKQYRREYYADTHNFRRKMINSSRGRARKKGMDFDLTVKGIDWPTHCPVFGWKLVYEVIPRPMNDRRFTPSIDRIDSSRGYTLDNVQVISMLANAMKSDATPEELKLFAGWILDS